jgi:membrane-associated phospholipid phosphatase
MIFLNYPLQLYLESMKSFNLRNYYIALAITFSIAVILLISSYYIGKSQFFLLLNGDAGHIADIFFAAVTWGGDGVMWVPVCLIIFFVLKKRDLIPLLASAIIFSTFFSHLFKDFILPNEPRPMRAITDGSYIHTVPGVQIDYLSSFPSGHTTTVFCFYLLFCLLIKKNWWLVAGLVFALLVGYSRVYLAEHFPFDVAGGMIAAILSVIISVKIQQLGWSKGIKKQNKTPDKL